jgi:hypothetical protein
MTKRPADRVNAEEVVDGARPIAPARLPAAAIPMATRMALEIPKPRNWQDFQRACVILYQAELNDPHVREYGRHGQKQHGIDLIGRRDGRPDRDVGIQCRLVKAPLKRVKIIADSRAALGLEPRLKEIIFATTAPDDTHSVDATASAERELRGEGHDIRIALYGWESLQLRIARHPSAWDAFNCAGLPLGSAQAAERLQRHVEQSNSSFGVIGLTRPLQMDTAWIELTIAVRSEDAPSSETIGQALERYHDIERRGPARDMQTVSDRAIGRFRPHNVVVAGPGMGKSLLLQRLALAYARDGFPVFKVDLRLLAAAVRQGRPFDQAVFELGIDGSGLEAEQVRALPRPVLLFDGLDEVGSDQDLIASRLVTFVEARPDARIIVATRPIGYETPRLAQWRHYQILPFDRDHASPHIARLLQGVFPGDEAEQEATLSFIKSQLSGNSESRLLTRSPLLLSLVTALGVNRVLIGNGKAELYERLFDLIERAPSHRVTERPPSEIAVRCLEALGMVVVEHPEIELRDAQGRTAELLARQLDMTRFDAVVQVERCIDFWQRVGMLERLHHGGKEVITFIHKTLGEFAAARALMRLPESDRERFIKDAAEKEWAAEALRFAGALGAAPLVIGTLLDCARAGSSPSCVARSLDLLVGARGGVPAELANEVLAMAFAEAIGDSSQQTDELVANLAAAAAAYPVEAAGQAAPLRHHSQSWVRLVTWTCLVAAGADHYDYQELTDLVRQLPRLLQSGVKPSLFGGIRLGFTNRNVAETFVEAAVAEIVRRAPDVEGDALIAELMAAKERWSSGLSRRVKNMLVKAGRPCPPVQDPLKHHRLFEQMERWDREYEQVTAIILDHLTAGYAVPEADSLDPERPLFHWSGFLQATKFDETPSNEIWDWRKAHEEAATGAIIRTAAQLCDLDYEQLREEAALLLCAIRAAPFESHRRTLAHKVEVDIPEIDYSGAAALAPDFDHLRAVLRHPSEWMAVLAANIFENAADPTQLAECVRDLYATGRGTALHIASYFARKMDAAEAETATRQRLLLPLAPGCHHLIDLLSELEPTADGQLGDIIRHCLTGGYVRSSASAARLAARFGRGSGVAAQDLVRAYDYWEEHEEPYPDKGGRVPETPRNAILEALSAMGHVDSDFLIRAARDRHFDVRKAAGDAVIERMRSDPGMRATLLRHVKSGSAPAGLLRDAIREGTSFSDHEKDEIAAFLESTEPRLRLAALELLRHDDEWLGRHRSLVRTLCSDPEAEIREIAETLLHGTTSNEPAQVE